jgi:STE24 endopeptidase
MQIIITILIISFLFERYLDYRNRKTWSFSIPAELSDLYSPSEYEKAQSYDLAKDKLSKLASVFSLVLLLALIVSGGFNLLHQWTVTITSDLVYQSLLFFGVLFVASDIIQLPFSLYSTFVIEEKFGFNRSSIATFFMDKLKGYLIGGLLGGSLLAMFVLFYLITGANFWWIMWITIIIVSMLLSMFYASLILPLFNKLTPLPEGELRKALEEYCNKAKFPLTDLFVMDGSKRSNKANAFFSGLGSKKRIVLYDTLIEKHSIEELVAIMAHEVGHYKLKHTRLMLVTSFFQTGLMLWIFSLAINQPWLSEAMGGKEKTFVLGVLAFVILYSPISLFLGMLMNMLSRKHEYEADNFAAKTSSSDSLITALKKLSKDNLSNLQPDSLYVKIYYSHPTLLQRIRSLNGNC